MKDPIASVERLYFTVTPEDIRYGKRCNPGLCPIARAAARALEKKINRKAKLIRKVRISVNGKIIEVVYTLEGSNTPVYHCFALSTYTTQLIRRFDAFPDETQLDYKTPQTFYAHKVSDMTPLHVRERLHEFGYIILNMDKEHAN